MRELALPQPGSDHQLAEQVARLHSRPLDRSHPLWELYVIQGVRGGRVAVMTKMHHSAIDGMSGAEILAQILDLDPDGRDVPPPPEDPCGERRPNDLEMLGRGLAAMPRQPLRALRALPSTLPNLDVTAFRNDVVVSMCAAATRRWLEAHEALPDRPLLAMIPYRSARRRSSAPSATRSR